MDLEERLAKVHKELASGRLRLETNVQVKVVRPILRSLGWDDADSSHLRAEYPTDNGRVDDALLDGSGYPVVFVEAKRQGYLKDPASRDIAERQMFGYVRRQPAQLLLLTDGETWDLYLRRTLGSPAERRFLSLDLTAPDNLEQAASGFRTFLDRGAVLEGRALQAAQARLVHQADRRVRRRAIQIAWRALLHPADESLQSLLSDRVEQVTRQRPPSAEVTEFLRQQGELDQSDDDPASTSARSGSYDEWFPDDLPRPDYSQDQLQQMSSVEMADVVEWWVSWWELEHRAESDSESGKLSSDMAFVLESQRTYARWTAAASEVREAAVEHVDVRAYLGSLKVAELREWAGRLGRGTAGLRKQDLVDELVDWLDWF
ncbi:MAG: hypothetical protein OXH42_07900 [Acidimicrobiaceae bacterium]|nr:hypothetical protein [Acidimicrobiaceae bacterium]MYG61367.1 hypothetical protein [Acidimicrobiales bacterium]